MTQLRHILLLWTAMLAATIAPATADKAPAKPAKPTVYAVVFDFATIGDAKGNSQVLQDQTFGQQLADSVRLKLRRNGKLWETVDRLTTQEIAGPIALSTPAAKVRELLDKRLGAHVGIYGQVQKVGDTVRAEIAFVDLRPGADRVTWSSVFSDDTARARAVIAGGVVKEILGHDLWRPPEYGDDPEPTAKEFGKPLNRDGGFETGEGWRKPDNVSTFLVDGKGERGGILRVRTNLQREPWLEYQKALLTGRASTDHPPKIAQDSSYGSVAGLEGVHFRGEFLPAKPGQRYWLTADLMPTTAKVNPTSMFFPKVFVKGFAATPHALDGLPESSLAELKLTPESFAALPPARRKELIAADARKHPTRYLREVYRWYLACRAPQGVWTHFAAPVPPRGGLPKNVEYLQIQVYTYWPPGEYLWDNVNLYLDPAQKAPLPEQAPRTPNFGRTSDVVEDEGKQTTTAPAKGGS